MDRIEKLIVAAIILVLLIIFVGAVRKEDKFAKACADSGGVAVHDGRQYQCLKPKGE